MTIAEWIDRRDRPVPAAFRTFLNADGPVSLANLLAAAEIEMRAYSTETSRDRCAGFALLTADAYLSYACHLAVRESGGTALGDITERVAREWIPPKLG